MEKRYSYSYIELICTVVIALLIFSGVIVPGIRNVTAKFNKTADILTAKNIYDSLTYGFVLDSISYPDRDTYIVLGDKNDINSSLDKAYKYNVMSYLENSLTTYPSKTKMSKENYVVHITVDGNIEILAGTQFGSSIYPKASGEYVTQ